jgi:hypothetical protein
VLLGPDFAARAAARSARRAEEAWMLRQPRSIRMSYVRDVIDQGEDPRLQERWMLVQPDDVRESYVREVIDADSR